MPPPGIGGNVKANIPGVVDPGQGAQVGDAPQQGELQDPNLMTPEEKAQYGGQEMFGDPSQADYDSVQQYGDQAYEQSMKRLNPQMETQNKRLQQEMINKGIDPNSAQGQRMQDDLSRQQADQKNSATFSALQFGQGIQNQMAQQEQQKANLAGQMQQGLWGAQGQASGQNLQKYLGDQSNQLGWGNLQSGHELGKAGLENQFSLGRSGQMNDYNLGAAGLDLQGQLGNQQNMLAQRGQDINYMLGAGGQNLQKYGMDQNFNLGAAGQDLQRYGMDQNFQLGQGAQDIQRQGQDFDQMMGMGDRDFRNQQYNDMLTRGDQRYNDQMLMSLLGFNKPGGAANIDPSGFGQALMNSAGQDKGLLGSLFGG